jgi:uncharacterized protein
MEEETRAVPTTVPAPVPVKTPEPLPMALPRESPTPPPFDGRLLPPDVDEVKLIAPLLMQLPYQTAILFFSMVYETARQVNVALQSNFYFPVRRFSISFELEAMIESWWTWTLLSGSAFAAGAVNAIAGGGTLLTFPSLLTVTDAVSANATSTMALCPGSIAAGWGYRDELARCRKHLWRLLPPSLMGGLIGSLLVTRLPKEVFASAVPWLLIGASLLLLLQKPLSKYLGAHAHEEPSPRTVAVIVFFQFLVGVYGGYFGAGIGILMLSSLAFMGIPNIHEMNAVKSILASAMNGITILIFLLSGVIVWKYALIMIVTGTLGGYAGARIARRTRPDIIRAIMVSIGIGVALYSWLARG